MITNKIIIENINERLERRGKSIDGRTILRIVWTADQFEKRVGTFSDWYGDIFLREYTAMKEVPKYWYITPPCWILERLTFLDPKAAIHRELIAQKDVDLDIYKPTLNGTYEPLYAFRNARTGQPLEVNDRVVDMILHKLMNPVQKRTESDAREEHFAELEADAEYFEAELTEAGRSPLFAFENSVFLDSTKRKGLTYTEKGKPDDILASVR
jgi:hypothetical protein